MGFASFPTVGVCYLNMSDFNSYQSLELINACLRDCNQARTVSRKMNLHWNGKIGWKVGEILTGGMSEEVSNLLDLKVLPIVGYLQ